MKKIIEKEVSLCDSCGREEGYLVPCMRCGIELCYDCRKKFGIEYQHAIGFLGHGDGFYCLDCDSILSLEGSDKLHSAYQTLARLKGEMDRFYADFNQKKEKIERIIKDRYAALYEEGRK